MTTTKTTSNRFGLEIGDYVDVVNLGTRERWETKINDIIDGLAYCYHEGSQQVFPVSLVSGVSLTNTFAFAQLFESTEEQ